MQSNYTERKFKEWWIPAYEWWLTWVGTGRGTEYREIMQFCCCSVTKSVQLWDSRTGGHQAPLSSTISWSLLKFMSSESALLSNHLILCHPLHLWPSIFPSIRVFSSEPLFAASGQSIGASTSASVLPKNIQSWFPLGLTGLISLQSKGLSKVFSSTTNWKNKLFGA